jgi:hypothetical protein
LAPPGISSIVRIGLSIVQVIVGLLTSFFILAIFISYFVAWTRASSQARFEKPFRRKNERSPFWRLSASMFFMALLLGAMMFGTWAENRNDHQGRQMQGALAAQSEASTTLNWKGFILKLPANYKQVPNDDDPAGGLIFLAGNGYACNFIVYERARMPATVSTNIVEIVDLDFRTLRDAGFSVEELERRRKNTIGYDCMDVHSILKSPDGSKCAYWTRFANFPDRLLLVKASRCDMPYDETGLETVFDKAQTVWSKAPDTQ